MQKNFLSSLGPNSGYILEQYETFLSNPSMLGAEWEEYFASHVSNQPVGSQNSELDLKIQKLIFTYRRFGHIKANVTALQATKKVASIKDFDIFSDDELDSEFVCELGKFNSVAELINKLESIYCGTFGVEFEHIESKVERDWIIEKIEQAKTTATQQQSESRLKDLVFSETFEDSLHKKFVGAKRFSLEGGDALIPMTRTLISKATELGLKEAVFGMAHRGRLNILHNIIEKPLKYFCAEFEDRTLATTLGEGDVKYHMGWETKSTYGNQEISLSLIPNPSHLEFVNPVVEGVVKAKQDTIYSENNSAIMPVLIHGDAAMIGQGVVVETFNFSQINGYSTAGTFHIVVNNEIGFTASSAEARSTRYCTTFAQSLGIPVFHVNGEDVNATCFIAELAAEYRMKFKKDVVVDLYCYRRYGHNEGDDPSFTSPVIYKEVSAKKPISYLYANANNLVSLRDSSIVEFKAKFEAAMTEKIVYPEREKIKFESCITEVSENSLKKIAEMFVKYPDNFVPHPKVKSLL